MSTTGKLGIAAVIIAGVTVYMAYLGSLSSWQYYLSVEECVGQASALIDQPIRVSGKVIAGSLRIGEGRKHASFRMGQGASAMEVDCHGPLPDNLGEEIEVVVEGRLDRSGRLQGDKVLTRCASKYEATPGPATDRDRAREVNLARDGRVEDHRR